MAMEHIYADLIRQDKKTLDAVPVRIRQSVKAVLDDTESTQEKVVETKQKEEK